MSDSDNKQTFRPLEELSYEQARDELVEVVKILELGQMSLDESLRFWERGEELAAYCERYLDGASERVEAALQNRRDADSADSADNPDNSSDEENGSEESE